MTSDHQEGRGGRRGHRGRRGPGGHPGRRHRRTRGDVRAAVLGLLSEQPMHGYQIMQELADRTGGAWQPSPGSVYPSLQQLSDEGLVASHDEDGRKIFELTDSGRAAAADVLEDKPPWERLAGPSGSGGLREEIRGVGAAAKQVVDHGTEAQIAKAGEILAEARKRLYQLLAE